ncbi:putative plasmid stabilization protein [Brevundimonas diminuta 3F5N]|uniref:Putative plasmid stabilization protein n=1 Tax=Brevundimonas diminuta 3F5N TaxID=1255603 RepID=A0A1R4G1J5_BREDI|nr:ParB N-terminal domain-containing protein [Brevundimonas diminuta]SJM62120.1 putative plasmid stabilization protein [Brevundimonas diminuta 3F5N]
MTRSALRAAAKAPASTPAVSTPSAPTRHIVVVRLGDLDVAPENLRHGEAPDDDISQLAETIAAAGLLQFPTVRPGRSDEAAHMVLDGRRRLLALRLLRDNGVIDDDHPVEVFVETDRARQAAAVVLTNTAVPVHVADVVAAIGRMLKARLGVKAIARALGYGEVEIRRLAALSALPAVALEALKSGRITLRQARLLARLKDADAQAELAQAVLDGHGLPEWRIQEQLGEGRITDRDPRCGLVSPDLYAAEGGRTEADLFGELPPVLLDPEALTRAWLKRAAEAAAPFEAEGLTVHLSAGDEGPDLPDDLEQLYYAYGGLSDEATLVYRAARDQAQAAGEVVAAIKPEAPDDDRAEAVEAFVRARVAQDQAGAGQRLATVLVLRPSLRTGVEVDCYGPAETEIDLARPTDDEAEEVDPALEAARPPVARSAYAPPRAEAPAPEVEGVSHVLHATRTDTATRGLIRALAEAPEVALSVLVARLFGAMSVWPPIGRSEAALAITASGFNPTGGRIIDALDGAVRERLDERRRAWEASGMTMIAWIHAMDQADRLGLLAALTALSLDLREDRTSLMRRVARTEAAEIADLCEADIARWWTPDGAYLRPHSREQLLTMLEQMGAETDAAARLRKGDLVAWTEDQARARNWAPACLSWRLASDGAADITDAEAADADASDAAGRPDLGDGLGDDAEAGDQAADSETVAGEARGGVGVFVVTPAGEAALVAAEVVDAVADDAAA